MNTKNYKIKKEDVVFNWELLRDFIGTVRGKLLEQQEFMKTDEENVYSHYQEWRIAIVSDLLPLIINMENKEIYKSDVLDQFDSMPALKEWIVEYMVDNETIDSRLWCSIADAFYTPLVDFYAPLVNDVFDQDDQDYIDQICKAVIFGDKYYALRYSYTHEGFDQRAMGILRRKAYGMNGADIIM